MRERRSHAAVLSFVAAFGVAEALSNLVAGEVADRVGRKRLLVLGWLSALPVAPLVAVAPDWGWILVANVFLGVNAGFAWSMTVVMIDLAGPKRRGLALGLNESGGISASRRPHSRAERSQPPPRPGPSSGSAPS